MAISFKKYIDIVSGVGGGASVRRRDLILRLYTTNPLVPTATVVEMTTLEDVGSYFGTNSEEYKRASFYFGFVSKSITRAKKISFYFYPETATSPRIFGEIKSFSVGQFTSITDGAFLLNIGGSLQSITGLNFSSATSLADVANTIQIAIRAKTGAQFENASVTYNATRKSFDFIGGGEEEATISVGDPTAGTSIVSLVGWTSQAIFSDGIGAQTITECLDQSVDISNNFASFAFIDELTTEETEEIGVWNTAQNIMYMFCKPVTLSNYADIFEEVKNYAGLALTLQQAGEYHELIPAIVLAATDYTRRNSTVNYMFQQFSATPTVSTTMLSNQLDDKRVNYYGRTQSAGQTIDFYQRGVLTGLPVHPVDMNTYANEIWLKDACGSAIMSLLLSLNKLSANTTGRGRLLSQIQSVIEEALFNGTISVGKSLDNTQKLYIAEITGDEEAWREVEQKGYWLDAVIQSYTTTDGRVEFKAVYTLIYSKDDTIRKVDGSHILI